MKIALCFILAMFYSLQNFACQCIETDYRKEIANTDLIFSGKVISVDSIFHTDTLRISNSPGEMKMHIVVRKQFEVKVIMKKIFKGRAEGDTVSIITGLGDGDCGFLFRPGNDYIIFGNRVCYKKMPYSKINEFDPEKNQRSFIEEMKGYRTDICMSTREYYKSNEDDLKKVLGLKE